jgi:hypothetical protein
MSQPSGGFRDFGILPEGLPPPPDQVRSYLSRGRIIGQYIGTGIGTAVGVGLALVLALTMPFPLNLLGAAATLAGVSAILYLATHNDYRWVELDGQTLRAQHLYTGRVIERSVKEIQCLATMVYPIRRTETRVIEALLGRVKGIEIRFRDRRTPLRVLRADPAMTNAKELIEALIQRMAQIGAVDAQVVNSAGAPLVRQIHWKGEPPSAPVSKTVKLCLACGVFFALMFGPVLGMIGVQESRRLSITEVPSQELTLQALIENGPRGNPHVVVTDFRLGGYCFLSKDGKLGVWSTVWVAMFPVAGDGKKPAGKSTEPAEIKAILKSRTLRSDAALGQFLKRGRVVGICTEEPRTNFGTTLGPNLQEANPDCPLVTAYEIEELNELPSGATIREAFLGASACFAVALLLALVIFRLK